MYRGPFRLLPLLALSISAALMAACTSESPTGPRIVAAVAVSGLGQSGFVGASLTQPFVVRVEDQNGHPVDGALVAWSVVSGGGTVSPSQSVTDSAGQASATLRLGSVVGQQSAQATLGEAKPVVFTASAIASAVAGTVIFGGGLYAGSRHTCGLDEGGVSYCWGYNGDGQLGLGQGAAGSGLVFTLPQPTAAAGKLTFAEVTGGRYHTCALTLSNIGYCWGAGLDGRNGAGGQTNVPTQIRTSEIFKAISAGRTHSCALTPDGRVFCWGANSLGQLGNGGTGSGLDTLATSPDSLTPGKRFVSVAAGGLHSCAVTTAGEAYCWGYNASGQLGNSTNTDAGVPTLVSGGITFASITAGENHTCGLSPSGQAYCWGDDAFGQLGAGGVGSSPDPVAAAGGLAFVALTAGFGHTCGITSSGVAYCWGRNARGELGDGTTTNRLGPVAVGGGLSFHMISAGGGDAGINPILAPAHTCGVTTAKVAYCWGDNQFGELGDGTQVMRPLPTKVAFQP